MNRVHPTEEHFEAMPTRTNAYRATIILGDDKLLLSNLQPICAPLHAITKHSMNWTWFEEAIKFFNI